MAGGFPCGYPLDRESLPGRHAHEIRRKDVRHRRLVGDRDDRDPGTRGSPQTLLIGGAEPDEHREPLDAVFDDGRCVAALPQLSGQQRHELARAGDPQWTSIADTPPQLAQE